MKPMERQLDADRHPDVPGPPSFRRTGDCGLGHKQIPTVVRAGAVSQKRRARISVRIRAVRRSAGQISICSAFRLATPDIANLRRSRPWGALFKRASIACSKEVSARISGAGMAPS